MNGDQQEWVLAARWIIPVTGQPINGGWVRVVSDRIAEVGPGPPPRGAQILGDVALLPGLVNAHTHLEFSDLASPIGGRGIPLARWIGKVVAARSTTTRHDREAAVDAGLAELSRTGTRLAGEITTPPCRARSDRWNIQWVRFAEVLGLSPERSAERLAAAARHCELDPCGAVSPHAPYSTTPETIQNCIQLARRHHRSLAMHVAESPAERQLLSSGRGPFAEALRDLGVWREDLFPWGQRPLSMLIDWLTKAPRVLLVHGNDLTDDEIQQLSPHDHCTVVYCPRTHHFFAYDRHPVDRMLAAGVRVALGTDSRASNPDLNLWRELQFLLRHRQDLSPWAVLRMATRDGADALGHRDIGRMEVGSRAQFGCVRSSAASIDQLYRDFSTNDYVCLSRC